MAYLIFCNESDGTLFKSGDDGVAQPSIENDGALDHYYVSRDSQLSTVDSGINERTLRFTLANDTGCTPIHTV
jgi:hypothetical protein